MQQNWRSSEHKEPQQTRSHLLPTLIDRLRDDAPYRKSERPEEYVMTARQIRQIIQRDLSYLLNTKNMADLVDRKKFPEAAASTINYGCDAIAGHYISEHRWLEIELMIRQAIFDFEPRINPSTLQVIPLLKSESEHSYNVILFEIRGEIFMDPYPIEFAVQSLFDLENQHVNMGTQRF